MRAGAEDAVKTAKPKNTGQFGKGNPGKPKGAVNKNTKALKDMILAALKAAGGEKYLLAQSKTNPSAFLALLGKILPAEIRAGNPDGSPFSHLTPEQLLAAADALRRQRG